MGANLFAFGISDLLMRRRKERPFYLFFWFAVVKNDAEIAFRIRRKYDLDFQ